MIGLGSSSLKAVLFSPFSPLKSLKHMCREHYLLDLQENLELANRKGHREMAGVLKVIKNRHKRKQLLKDADQILLGGRIIRTYRRIRKERLRLVDWVSVVPPRE